MYGAIRQKQVVSTTKNSDLTLVLRGCMNIGVGLYCAMQRVPDQAVHQCFEHEIPLELRRGQLQPVLRGVQAVQFKGQQLLCAV